jgi:hypothetical protein
MAPCWKDHILSSFLQTLIKMVKVFIIPFYFSTNYNPNMAWTFVIPSFFESFNLTWQKCCDTFICKTLSMYKHGL